MGSLVRGVILLLGLGIHLRAYITLVTVCFSITHLATKLSYIYLQLICSFTKYADEKIKLWLFVPGRHSSVVDKAKAAVSKLRGKLIILIIYIYFLYFYQFSVLRHCNLCLLMYCSFCIWSVVSTRGFWRGGSCTLSSSKELYRKVSLIFILLFLFRYNFCKIYI